MTPTGADPQSWWGKFPWQYTKGAFAREKLLSVSSKEKNLIVIYLFIFLFFYLLSPEWVLWRDGGPSQEKHRPCGRRKKTKKTAEANRRLESIQEKSCECLLSLIRPISADRKWGSQQEDGQWSKDDRGGGEEESRPKQRLLLRFPRAGFHTGWQRGRDVDSAPQPKRILASGRVSGSQVSSRCSPVFFSIF